MGLEACGRQVRYQFFHFLAPGEADRILTAHNAQDNAETMLLHLCRGTGLAGLCGIPPRRGKVLRPFLGVDRRGDRILLRRKRPFLCDGQHQPHRRLRPQPAAQGGAPPAGGAEPPVRPGGGAGRGPFAPGPGLFRVPGRRPAGPGPAALGPGGKAPAGSPPQPAGPGPGPVPGGGRLPGPGEKALRPGRRPAGDRRGPVPAGGRGGPVPPGGVLRLAPGPRRPLPGGGGPGGEPPSRRKGPDFTEKITGKWGAGPKNS